MTSVDLRGCRLYGILDLSYIEGGDVARFASEMIEGGVDILQLRAKEKSIAEISAIARELRVQTSRARVPLIINDYAQIARDVGADGAHVGQDDVSIADVRKLLGPYGLVGKSTHSLEQARDAEAEGADYIGFGPLFATPTKPDYVATGLAEIAAIHEGVSVPIFCIGGIKIESLPTVIVAGAQRVVIVSGLLQAADVAEYARSAKALLYRNSEIQNRK